MDRIQICSAFDLNFIASAALGWSGYTESNRDPQLGRLLHYRCAIPAHVAFIAQNWQVVEGTGFEPVYAKRADLQSAGFNHSPTPPGHLHSCCLTPPSPTVRRGFETHRQATGNGLIMTKHNARNRSNPSDSRRPKSDKQSAQTWLWGHHAVEAALRNPVRKQLRLMTTRNAAQRLGSLAHRAEDTSPRDLDRLLPPGAVHQGIAGQFHPLEPQAVDDVIASDISRIVILDQLSDPHNLGAIFRSAAAFGFGAVIMQTRNAPPVTGIVAKSAAGSIETVTECRAVNIARALDALTQAGFHTVGLAGSGRATIERAVHGAAKVAIVLGAEGPGLRPGVAKACAELAHIPINPDMESLNVSNAAAIAFYEVARGMQGPAS